MTRLVLSVCALGILVAPASAGSDYEADAKKYIAQLNAAKEPKKRAEAIEKLGEIGQVRISYVEAAVPVIMECLKDKDAAVRSAAAEAIGKLDPDPDEAIPALVKLLEDKEDPVKISAARGLMAMGSRAKPAVPDLRAGIKREQDNNRVRNAFRNAVRRITGR